MEETVLAILKKVLDDHDDNKQAAAKALDTNPVTYWGWVQETRGFGQAIFHALDMAGAKLLMPGEEPADASQDIEKLKEQIANLQRENELLNKLVERYEYEAESEGKSKFPEKPFTQSGIQSSHHAGTNEN